MLAPLLRLGASFPTPAFEGDYTFPAEQRPALPEAFWTWLDLGFLVMALLVAAYLVHRRRSRKGLLAVAILSLIWFGFVKAGCVCSVGSLQNVSAALANGTTLPFAVVAVFVLPLAAALLWGRIFCAGVCPLGALQELVLLRPRRVPAGLLAVLDFLPVVYLGLAVVFAASHLGFVICEFDPFVRIFRGTGTVTMVLIAGGMVALSLVVGRPYCRWLCPYGVLLGLVSKVARRPVTIPEGDCVNCHLCKDSCPYDAIDPMSEELPAAEENRLAVRERRVLLVTVLVTPLLVWGAVLAGQAMAGVVAHRHPAVRMVAHAQAALAGSETLPDGQPVDEDVVAGFGRLHVPIEALTAEAEGARRTLERRLGIMGGLLAVALAFHVVLLARRPRNTIYRASAYRCLGCARCYDDCPVPEEDGGQG